MIVRPRPNFFQLFYLFEGSVLRRIMPEILVVTALSTLLVLLHRRMPGIVPNYTNAPFSLVGIALSIFLAFRNSACYDRWWEARILWGTIIHASRSLARQTRVLDTDAEGRALRERLIRANIAFVHQLVPHLRSTPDAGPEGMLPENVRDGLTISRNRPDRILNFMEQEIAQMRHAGRISDILFQTLDKTLHEISLAFTGCERLRFTPVPFGYTLLLHRTAWLFCLFIPFGFADVLGFATPFAVALVAYCFFGLDAIGDQMERPFGTHPNALPLSAMAETVEINLRESLGETDLPPLPRPINHILM